jgi:hypothetical protein
MAGQYLKSCVVDRHRFNADPNPDTTPSFAHVGRSEKFFLLLFTAVPVCTVLFSRQRNRCHNFKIFFGSLIKIFWKKYSLASSHMAEMDKGPAPQALGSGSRSDSGSTTLA